MEYTDVNNKIISLIYQLTNYDLSTSVSVYPILYYLWSRYICTYRYIDTSTVPIYIYIYVHMDRTIESGLGYTNTEGWLPQLLLVIIFVPERSPAKVKANS